MGHLFGKPHTLLRTPTTLLLIISFALILLTLIPLRHPLLGYPDPPSLPRISPSSAHLLSEQLPTKFFEEVGDDKYNYDKCDLFSGEWVPNPEAPYYTNTTCWEIHEHQNCMKYGRPDSDFMKWRWKPDGCELPIFDPQQFLEIVRNKSLAFVGDSIGRNQMQSLICLLSRVEWPVDVSYTTDFRFKRWSYKNYNFTLATFWSPHLVKSQESNSKVSDPYNLYLDEFNEKWTSQIEEFDYVVINAGHWFYRPTTYYESRRIVGCHYCNRNNVSKLTMLYGYRKAFKTAFRALNSLENYKGVTFLRTFAPSHFEGGEWNKGGNCARRRPFKSNETRLEGTNLELQKIQLEELKEAEMEGKKKFRLLDITQATLLRPDGHPSSYWHWAHENFTYNDCVHWCLPGPIDTWNDFLLELMKMEERIRHKFYKD